MSTNDAPLSWMDGSLLTIMARAEAQRPGARVLVDSRGRVEYDDRADRSIEHLVGAGLLTETSPTVGAVRYYEFTDEGRRRAREVRSGR